MDDDGVTHMHGKNFNAHLKRIKNALNIKFFDSLFTFDE